MHAFADESFLCTHILWWRFSSQSIKVGISQFIYIFEWIDNQCLYTYFFYIPVHEYINMDYISLEIYYQPVFTDKEILIQFSNGTYQRENQTSLWFLISCKT